MQHVVIIALVIVIALFIVHQYNPYLFSEGFADAPKKDDKAKADKEKADKAKADKDKAKAPAADKKKAGFQNEHFADAEKKEGFADLNGYEGPAQFGSAESPAGCYPRDQLTPSELLPKDQHSVWAEQTPMGVGSLKGKNFLSAGALMGVNTVGQSMRNANHQIRSEPANPQNAVSIWNSSTISPDISHRTLEVGQ